MKFCINILAFAGALLAASATVTSQEEALLQIFPDMKTSSVLKPPGASENNSTTVVAVNMYILDIHDIDDEKQEVSVSMYFRQRWTDPRLKFTTSNPDVTHVVLSDREKLWVPDTFFVNERKTRFADAMTDNSFIKIFTDGRVIYSARVHTKLACKLDHKNFPFDKQTCSLRIESYGHSKKDITYSWFISDGAFPVGVAKDLTLKPFELEAYGVGETSETFNNIEYTNLRVEFLFARTGFGRYFMQAYLPLGLAVVIAYLTLWLRFEWAIKVNLAGASILVTSILAAFGSNLGPAISGCTALNAWGFWSVVLSALPLAVLLLARLLSPKVANSIDEEKKGDGNSSTDSLVHTDTRIEKIAVFVIPLIFFLYNFVYWVNYADRIDMENGLTVDMKKAY